jgi:hypothetical protein
MSVGEGPSSTQVEPSTAQGQASSIEQPSASQPLQQPQVRQQQQQQQQQQPQAHQQQQPPPSDEGQASSSTRDVSGSNIPDTTFPNSPGSSGSHDVDDDDDAPDNNNDGQGEDPNHDEDQEASQESIPKANTHREDPTTRNLCLKSHSLRNILGDLKSKVSTQRQLANFCEHHAFVSMVEPLKGYDALEDPDWLLAMHEELNNFKRNDV